MITRKPRSEAGLIAQVERSSPEKCVHLLSQPSSTLYITLKKRLANVSWGWIKEFLDFGGLRCLLECLDQLSMKGFSSFTDAILQIDCLECCKAVLDFPMGMVYLIEEDDYISVLIQTLDTGNALYKKQMIEMLTAICVFNKDGHKKILDGLDHFKKSKGHYHRFSFLINELKISEASMFRTTIMCFINSLIGSHEDLMDRHGVRCEIDGLQFSDVLHFLRLEDKDAELAIQMQLYDESKLNDESELDRRHGVDINSATDLLSAILNKIYGKPSYTQFLHILQDLHHLESNNAERTQAWGLASKAVHHISNLQDQSQVSECYSKFQDLQLNTNVEARPSSPLNLSVYDLGEMWETLPPQINSCGKVPPRPEWPVKNIKWVPLKPSEATNPISVWNQIHQFPNPDLHLNFNKLAQEFRDTNAMSGHDADDEIELLRPDQSLSINLFLSRHDASPEEIVQSIRDLDDPSLDTLRYLHRILPTDGEIKYLRLYNSKRFDLGQAENFVLQLSDVTDYRVRLQCLLFQAEFPYEYQRLQSAAQAMNQASRDILHHPAFRDFAQLLLEAGNFLNTCEPNGCARGVTLESWEKVMQVRGKEPCHSLLHHIMEQAELENEAVLSFLQCLPNLEKAASHSLDDLKNDVTKLNSGLEKIVESLEDVRQPVREHFQPFIQDMEHQLRDLQENVTHLKSLSNQLAMYFCEDKTSFDLRDCFKHVFNFFNTAKKCQQERRVYREEKRKTEARKQKLDVENEWSCDIISGDLAAGSEKGVVDRLVDQVHRGNVGPQLHNLYNEENEISLGLKPILQTSTPLASKHRMPSNPAASAIKKIYPDRVEEIIAKQYHRDNQKTTASYLYNEQSKVPRTTNGHDIKKPVIKPRYRDLPQTTRDDEVVPWVIKRRRGHYRSKSDINESTLVEVRVMKYEDRKEEKKAPICKPESHSSIASLNLERRVQERSSQADRKSVLMPLNLNKIDNCADVNGGKKKKGNFFRRLSNRMRRSKNDGQDVFKKPFPVDKENVRTTVL